MDLYGGTNSAVNSVAADATAFGHRDALWTIQFYASSSPFPSDGFTFLDSKYCRLLLNNALTDMLDMVDSLTSNTPAGWDIG